MNNYDDKLLKKNLDEINRLTSQLQDLETNKDEFTLEEREQIKKETQEQLINTNKMLEKMKSGKSTTVTAEEEARMKLHQVLCENYNVKELLNTYLANEVAFLREKLKSLTRQLALKKISNDEYNSSSIQLLELIAKNTTLNEEEQKIYNSLKKKNMNQMQDDKGIDKEKIEKNINQK